MPSLWGVVHELATGAVWPPADEDAAARFLLRVNQESLLPLLFDDPPQHEVVRAVMTRFRAMERAHVARTKLIARALDQLGDLLRDEPFIVLKGCDYAFRLYARPELRPMADIDVLVPEDQLRRVADLLAQRGLKRQFPAGTASRVDSHHEAVFTVSEVTVEVHHRFIQRWRHRIAYDGVWNRARPLETPHLRALRLSDADAIAYQTIGICLKYFAAPLIRYVDLWLLAEQDDEALEKAAELAIEWRARHSFYAAMRYGARLFPELATARYESVMQRVLDRSARAFIDRSVVPRPHAGPKTVPSRVVQLWRKFWTIDSMYLRSRFAAEHAAALVRGRFAT